VSAHRSSFARKDASVTAPSRSTSSSNAGSENAPPSFASAAARAARIVSQPTKYVASCPGVPAWRSAYASAIARGRPAQRRLLR